MFILVASLSLFSFSAFAQNDAQLSNESDYIFITGLVKDADSQSVLQDSELDFYADGLDIMYAKISETGHYAIAIAKDYMNESTDLIIRIDGYTDAVIENIYSLSDYISLDLFLSEDENEEEDVNGSSYVPTMISPIFESTYSASPFGNFVFGF